MSAPDETTRPGRIGKTMENKISFNTGRHYSASGQRIAATKLDCGRVLFVDIDRRLEYVTAAPCELSEHSVMRAYDYNSTTDAYSVIPDYEIRTKLCSELEALARKL
jgi:hypothetical protein